MEDTNHASSRKWWAVLLRDPHWWAPVIALMAGLFVLRWVQ